MRCPEWPTPANGAVLQLACKALDHGNLERLARIERGQQSGKPRGEHRLAGARRSYHEQIVATCSGDLEGTLGRFLAFHVAQVGDRAAFIRHAGARGCEDLNALEVIDEGHERGRCNYLQAFGPCGHGASRLRPQ